MSERKLEAGFLLARLAVLGTPVNQKLGKFLRRGVRQTQGANFVAGVVVLFTQLFGHLKARVRVVFQEAQEVFPFYEIDLARIDGFGSEFVGFAGNRGAEAEDFARFCNFQDQGLAVGGADRELHPSLAEDENAAWRLAFDEQDRPFRVGGGVLDGLEGLQSRGWQIAENAVGPHFASQAAFDNVESVW